MKAQSGFVVENFILPHHVSVFGESTFFLEHPQEVSLTTLSANSDIPSSFLSLLRSKKIEDVISATKSDQALRQPHYQGALKEFEKIKSTGSKLFVNAILRFSIKNREYMIVKFEVPSMMGSENNIYAAYAFEKIKDKWLYMLNNKLFMVTITVLSLKPRSLFDLITNSKNNSEIGRSLPDYCFTNDGELVDLLQTGREILTYFGEKKLNSKFTNMHCVPLK